jgi:hypothetical protein
VCHVLFEKKKPLEYRPRREKRTTSTKRERRKSGLVSFLIASLLWAASMLARSASRNPTIAPNTKVGPSKISADGAVIKASSRRLNNKVHVPQQFNEMTAQKYASYSSRHPDGDFRVYVLRCGEYGLANI